MTPNQLIHNKWANKIGIEDLISNHVNRLIDYGLDWALIEDELEDEVLDEIKVIKQLKYFYNKDIEKQYSSENLYIKAFYLHHLLDYFRETRHNIHDLELVFKKFLQEKVVLEFTDKNGNRINFQKEINELFELLRRNEQELYRDLLGK